MRGQKSRLNLGLRKLFAKISKEFDFPAVYAVRCRIETSVRQPDRTIEVLCRGLEPPRTKVLNLTTQFPVACLDETLEQAECRTETPLEQLITSVETVDCYQCETVEVVTPLMVDPVIEVKRPDFTMAEAMVHAKIFAVSPPDLLSTPLLGRPGIRGGPMLARTLPYRLEVLPMGELNKRLLIRFRAAVLKQLNLKPTHVKFVGVVRNLPPAPLRVLRYEEGLVDGRDQVLIRLRGARNEHLGKRTWVFVRLEGKDNYLPVTVREEEE